MQVFGLPSLEGVDTAGLPLPHLDSDISMRINNVIGVLRNKPFIYPQARPRPPSLTRSPMGFQIPQPSFVLIKHGIIITS